MAIDMRFPLFLFFFLIPFYHSWAQTSPLEDAKKYAHDRQFEQAIAILDSLIEFGPKREGFHRLKVVYLLELDQLKEAATTLNDAIQSMPDSSSLYHMRGTMLAGLGLYEEAIQDFNTGYKLTDKNELKSQFLSNLGGTKYRFRDFEGAYFDLVQAVAFDSANIDALNNLALVCNEVNKKDEMLQYLEKIIVIDPTYTPAYVNLGYRNQLMGNHQVAIEYFDTVIELDPEEAFGYSNRSFSKLKTNDFEGAIVDINKSLALSPSNSYAYKIRALIKFAKGHTYAGCLDLERALELGYTTQYGEEVNDLMDLHCNKGQQN